MIVDEFDQPSLSISVVKSIDGLAVVVYIGTTWDIASFMDGCKNSDT